MLILYMADEEHKEWLQSQKERASHAKRHEAPTRMNDEETTERAPNPEVVEEEDDDEPVIPEADAEAEE